MKAFIIEAGTEVKMIPVETYSGGGFMALRDYTTKAEKMFFVEDVIVDPIGSVGSGPSEKTVGGVWAKAGWYGFALADPERYPKGEPGAKWYGVLVPGDKVVVG